MASVVTMRALVRARAAIRRRCAAPARRRAPIRSAASAPIACAQAVSCLDIVSGFNGTSCEVFASPNRGVCRPRAGACYPLTHNATVCKQISVVAPFSCASMGCVKSNACVPGAAKQTVDSIGEICFTSADSSALDSCASPSERCDDRGSCVVTVTPAPPTDAPTPAPPTSCAHAGADASAGQQRRRHPCRSCRAA
jgi:hypothetical protein